MKRLISYLLIYLITFMPVVSAWAYDWRAFCNRAGVSPEGLVSGLIASDATNQTQYDGSGHGNHTEQTTGAAQPSIVSAVGARTAWDFAGSHYVTQKVYDDETGATDFRLSTVDGTAFAWVPGVDLSPYAVATDATESVYEAIFTDSAGKSAKGYIGAAGTGAAETGDLGSEKISGGGMEVGDPPADWVYEANTTESSIADERTGGSGTQSLNLIISAGPNKQAAQVLALTQGMLLWGEAWGKTDGLLYVSYYKNPHLLRIIDSLVSGTWEKENTFKTIRETGDWDLQIDNVGVDDTFIRIDDVSVKQVTEPPATAVHITSTPGGSTRNWTVIDSGFDPNDASMTFEIRKVDLSLTGDFSIIAAVKPDDGQPASVEVIASKYRTTNDHRVLYLRIDADGKLRLTVSEDGAAGTTVSEVTDNAVFADGVQGNFTIAGAIKSGAAGAIYINGSVVASGGTVLPTTLFDSPVEFRIGSDTGSWFNGQIAFVLIWSRTLTAAENQRLVLQAWEDGLVSRN